MHYKYFNSFHTYCHDFADTDEIIFMIALCGLSRVVDHPTHVFDVNVAITHFRDNGRPLHSRVYSGIEAAWESRARCDPPLALQFVNDPVDAVPTEQAAKERRRKLWNGVMNELRFPDRVDVEEDGECRNATLSFRE
jgi:hypothetical protein